MAIFGGTLTGPVSSVAGTRITAMSPVSSGKGHLGYRGESRCARNGPSAGHRDVCRFKREIRQILKRRGPFSGTVFRY